jgi:hypothetical protein
MSLRERMAEFGFESNDDYEFQLRALFESRAANLRCLHVDGESGRRKTAFAHALARALDYPHVLYHDFSVPEPPPAPIVLSEDSKDHPEPIEAPLTGFERAVTEACAFSEAARTVLIVDQLQEADFREQTRLYHFVRTGEWEAGSGQVRANARNLLVVLVTEATLYHSLAKVSYRIWTDASAGRFAFRPEDFGLGADAREAFGRLAALFDALGSSPTPSEMRHIVDDLMRFVRTEDQLRHTIYGWMERVDRAALFSAALVPEVRAAVEALNAYAGLEEVVLRG